MSPSNNATVVDSEVVDRILAALSGLKYGSVQITVQDSRVIQIDKTEKLRLLADNSRDAR